MSGRIDRCLCMLASDLISHFNWKAYLNAFTYNLCALNALLFLLYYSRRNGRDSRVGFTIGLIDRCLCMLASDLISQLNCKAYLNAFTYNLCELNALLFYYTTPTEVERFESEAQGTAEILPPQTTIAFHGGGCFLPSFCSLFFLIFFSLVYQCLDRRGWV